MPRELIATAPGQTEFREYEERPLGEREVRIRTEFASPKHGTESHGFLGDSPFAGRRFDPELRIFLPAEEAHPQFPRSLGNMAVGVVTEVGEKVTKFKIGDRVYGHLPIRETQTVHELGRSQGEVPLGSGVRESRLHLLPDGMRPEAAVLLDPAHFALGAVRDANIRLGEWVAVFGLGAIGLLIVQMARLSGAERIMAVDPLENRRKLAATLGAALTLDPTACDAGLEIKKATERRGVDVAVDASGSYDAFQAAIRSVHYSGLVVTCSFFHGPGTPLRLDQEWLLTRVTVKVSMPVWGNPSRDYPAWDGERIEDTVYRLMLAGALQTDGFLDPVVSFEEADAAYEMIAEHPERCVKLGITFPAGER
jgi:threonine dehydrogenase-like Zn-dependent dehydrogenase